MKDEVISDKWNERAFYVFLVGAVALLLGVYYWGRYDGYREANADFAQAAKADRWELREISGAPMRINTQDGQVQMFFPGSLRWSTLGKSGVETFSVATLTAAAKTGTSPRLVKPWELDAEAPTDDKIGRR